MDPTCSPEDAINALDRSKLLSIARGSISHGLAHHKPLAVDATQHSAALQEPKGCFVTLHLHDALRGCVGSLRARGPLVAEVARSAYSAAFRDTRFQPVSASEAEQLDVHVSVLSEPLPLQFSDEADLLAQLRPGVDGLILSDGARLGTFLPQVWDKFPDPKDFMVQLRLKAGLPHDHWSDSLTVERYTTESFS